MRRELEVEDTRGEPFGLSTCGAGRQRWALRRAQRPGRHVAGRGRTWSSSMSNSSSESVSPSEASESEPAPFLLAAAGTTSKPCLDVRVDASLLRARRLACRCGGQAATRLQWVKRRRGAANQAGGSLRTISASMHALREQRAQRYDIPCRQEAFTDWQGGFMLVE